MTVSEGAVIRVLVSRKSRSDRRDRGRGRSRAVVVTAREPLTILSSAFVRGGFTTARAIVNLHVRKNIPEAETDGLLPRFADRRGIRGPWVGLLTSAWTEKAVVAEATAFG